MDNSKKIELCIKNLSKDFGEKQGRHIKVLDAINFNLSLEKGEKKFVVFLGPSGCGKTTLLRIIAGLEEPSGGSINFAGKKTELGWSSMVFQEFSLFPWCTVQENVEFGLKMQGISKRERKEMALTFLKKVGLDGFESAFPYEISGGMKQRVAVARSLVVKTPLLLMDEPFSAVDMITREKMYDFMWDIWTKTDVSIIMVTHNVEEAILLGDIIYLMSPAPSKIVKSINSDFKPADRFTRYRELEEIVRIVKKEIFSAYNKSDNLKTSTQNISPV